MKILERKKLDNIQGLRVTEINVILEKLTPLEFARLHFDGEYSEFIKMYKPGYKLSPVRSLDNMVSDGIVHKYYIDNVDEDWVYISHRFRDYEAEKEEKYNKFKEINIVERKANFIKKLISESKITDDNFVLSVANNIDLDIMDINIKVIEDPKEFGKILILENNQMEHSWAGSQGTEENGKLLYGKDLIFGENYYYEYSNNGNMSSPDERRKIAEFDIDKTYAVIINNYYWDHYNGNDQDEHTYTIVVYKGNKNSFTIDEDLKKIIDKYNLKDENTN